MLLEQSGSERKGLKNPVQAWGPFLESPENFSGPKFEGLEPRRCEGIMAIVAPEIGPKSFGTFEKQAPSLNFSGLSLTTAKLAK